MVPRIPIWMAFGVILADFAMIAVALLRYPPFISQPSARLLVLEPVLLLALYAIATFLIGKQRGTVWKSIIRIAAAFGIAGGIVELVNIAIENGIPAEVRIPDLSLVFMIAVFASWGAAGVRAVRTLQSVRAGVLTAILAASVCMLIAVTAGFVVQLFVAMPNAATVTTWAEFKRSGWTDPRAFGMADTLDSAFTHLLFAPIGALVVGGASSLVTHLTDSNRLIPPMGPTEGE